MKVHERWFQYLRNNGMNVKEATAIMQRCVFEINDINWADDYDPASSSSSDDHIRRRINEQVVSYLKEVRPNSRLIRLYE